MSTRVECPACHAAVNSYTTVPGACYRTYFCYRCRGVWSVQCAVHEELRETVSAPGWEISGAAAAVTRHEDDAW